MRAAGAAAILSIVMAGTLSAQQQRPAVASGHSFSQSVRDAWNSAKRNIVESADQMPEENYSFKPVDTVRTFGQILAHVAGASYVLCSAAKGEKSPFEEDHFEKTATTKAAIVKALAASNAYCDQAFSALTDATARQPVKDPFGSGQSPRVSTLLSNTGHLNEHYGNLVTYFRLKGMVPPSSKRQ